jgi:hypothetical protein
MPLRLMTDSEVRRKDEDEAKRKAVSGYKDGGKVMKPCAGCPSPAKCKAAGKCMGGKAPAKGMGKGYAMGGKVLVKGKNC